MIINLVVLSFLIGVIAALNVGSLLPIFVIRFLVRLGFFKTGTLGYEKYQHTDSTNRTTTRSRYFYRSSENIKDTCTGKVNLILVALFVLIFETLSLGIYFLFL